MMALFDREVTGVGRWVQTSLIEAGLTLLDFQATRWTMDKKVPPQEGNNHPTNTPMGLFPHRRRLSQPRRHQQQEFSGYSAS